MELPWIHIISVAAAFQGVLLFILLLTKKPVRPPNRYLAVFVLILAGDGLEPLWLDNEFAGYELLLILWGGMIFLHGPLLYLYVMGVLGKNIKNLRIHFLPAILYVVLVPVLLFNLPFYESNAQLISTVLQELFYIQVIAYTIVALKVVIKSLRGKATNRSLWLKYFPTVMLLLYLISFSRGHFFSLTDIKLDHIDLMVQFLLMATVYTISYLVLAHPDWISSKNLQKYATSKLDANLIESWSDQLDQWMTNSKAFTRADLNSDDVAEAVSISRHQLSQILSSAKRQNFYEYLNSLRVEEFIRLLNQGKARQQTLLALSREAGFSSKTTFNNAFKKSTGMTPSQ